MDLLLKRSYFEKGTNGALFINGVLICFMIELPWKDNKKEISCIPEGSYNVIPRVSKRFGNHLHVQDVYNRSLILIHPANNAEKELRGCLAPVSQLNGIGQGWSSRAALNKLQSLCYQTYDLHQKVTLIITS